MDRRTATAALCWGLAAIWALWALVRLTGIERGFPLVPLIAYTPYMALAALAPLAIALVLRRWLPAAVIGLAALALVLAVLPRTSGDAEAAEPLGGPRVRVLSANIYRGEGNLADLVRLTRERDADLLLIQELSPEAAAELDRLGIGAMLPHRVLALEDRKFGGGIYSRFSLRRLAPAPEMELRMPRASARLPDGSRLRIVDVHPYPPTGFGKVSAWKQGLRSLPAAGPRRAPWLLAGDFNATLDHAELRRVLDSGYRDAADVHGAGLSMTWSAWAIVPPVAIDHILADERIAITEFAVESLPASDHQPIYAELSLPAAGRRRAG